MVFGVRSWALKTSHGAATEQQTRSRCGAAMEQLRSKCGAGAEQLRSSYGAATEQLRSKCGAATEQLRSSRHEAIFIASSGWIRRCYRRASASALLRVVVFGVGPWALQLAFGGFSKFKTCNLHPARLQLPICCVSVTSSLRLSACPRSVLNRKANGKATQRAKCVCQYVATRDNTTQHDTI